MPNLKHLERQYRKTFGDKKCSRGPQFSLATTPVQKKMKIEHSNHPNDSLDENTISYTFYHFFTFLSIVGEVLV